MCAESTGPDLYLWFTLSYQGQDNTFRYYTGHLCTKKGFVIMLKHLYILRAAMLVLSCICFFGCGAPANQTDSTGSDQSALVLDQSYHNERFGFSVKYPGAWETYEEPFVENTEQPDQGFYIYIENNEDNYITVFGQVSGIAIFDPSMTISDYITNQGVKGKSGLLIYDNTVNQYIVLDETLQRWGVHVRADQATFNKYQKLIEEICKCVEIDQDRL